MPLTNGYRCNERLMDGGQITGMAGWDTSPAAGKGGRGSFGASRGQEGGRGKAHSKAKRPSDPVKEKLGNFK